MRGLIAAALTVALTVTLAAAPVLAHESLLFFKKVDYYLTLEGKTSKLDARLVLDPGLRELVVTDEDHPGLATFARIPYDAITSISYSRSKHPRWKLGAGLLVPLSVFAIPFFFLKGKKHWLTVTYTGVPEHPEGFLYLRLDKDNYRPIIGALEGQTGIPVERLLEG